MSGVYPAYAFERSIFNIVITSDNFPIVWRKPFAEDLEIELDALQLVELNVCNADANCSQNAVNAGAIYFKVVASSYGDYIAYYDENGKLVGTSLASEDPSEEIAELDTSGVSGNMVSYVVGSLPGEFSVSPAGGANYSIPIEIPPGTAGVAPDISLSYDSQAGNGIAGVGWSMGGISQISRCPATKLIDGYPGAINHDSKDKFCLNGQRLISIPGAHGTGAYGASGTKYRTQIDNGQKITSYGTAGFGPAYFVVNTKGGSTMTYGLVEPGYDSRFEANRSGILASSTVSQWALGKVEDVNGNYYKIAYAEDHSYGSIITFTSPSGNRVLRIDYTGNDLSNPMLAPYASVVFSYQARNDIISHYTGGSKYVEGTRLSNIKTYVDDTLVKDYRLSYDYSPLTKQSRIKSIQECSISNCKPATSFNWQNGSASLKYDMKPHPAGGWGDPAYTRMGDFNGDGKQDIFSAVGGGSSTPGATIKLSNGTNMGSQRWPISAGNWGGADYTWTGDFTGDGKTDVATAIHNNLYVHTSTGTSFKSKLWSSTAAWGAGSYSWTGDFDGDGRTDIASAYYNTVYVYLARNGYFVKQNWSAQGIGWGADVRTWTGDFNGDGLTDIVSYNGSLGMQVLLSTGTGFKLQDWSNTYANWGSHEYTWTGDFNGDGKTDIASAVHGMVYVWASTGRGFSIQQWPSSSLGSASLTWPGDFNGDGKTDIATVFGSTIQMSLSTGMGFQQQQWSGTNSTWGDWRYANAADINGDGLTDMVAAGNGNLYFRLSKGEMPDLITKATNGFGNPSAVSYSPLTNNAIYNKEVASYYPYMNTQTAKQVVTNKTTIDGLGGNTTTSYKYTDDRIHLAGYGPLGFRKTRSENHDTGLVTDVLYQQGFPYVGMVKTESQKLNNVEISKTIKTPSSKYPGNGRYIPFVWIDETIAKDITGVELKRVKATNALDMLGNVTETKVDTYSLASNEHHITTTTTEYGDTGIDWCSPFLATKSSSSTSSPLGVSPTAVKEFVYDTCKLDNETGYVVNAGVRTNGLSKHHSYDDDRFGHVNKTVVSGPDIEPRQIDSVFDGRGRFATSVTNELGHVATTNEHDQRFGGVKRSTDVNGLVTAWQYDDFGQEIEQLSPGGMRKVSERDWCTSGCTVLPVTSAYRGQSSLFTGTTRLYGGSQSLEQFVPDVTVYFDKLGREIRKQSTNALGRLINSDTNYDKLGRVVATTQPYFSNAPADKNPSTTSYDDLGRPKVQTSPDGGETSVEYNGFNVTYTANIINLVDGSSSTQTRTEINDIVGKNIESIDNQGDSIYREFDAQGNNIRILAPKLDATGLNVVDPRGTVTSFEFDDFGRKKLMNDPDMGEWTYDYNSLSKLISQRDANGAITTMEYDILGRMVKRIDADNVTTLWQYNDNKNAGQVPPAMSVGKLDRVVMSNAANQEIYSQSIEYDALLGLPLSTSVKLNGQASETYVTRTSYDRFNRPEVLTYPKTGVDTAGIDINFKVRNVYDIAGALSEIQSEDGVTTYWKADYRDAANRVTISTLGNGITTFSSIDKMGRAALITAANANADLLYEGIYKYDTVGNLLKRTAKHAVMLEPRTEEYAYDNLNRLITVTENSLLKLSNSYDVLGNIRNKMNVGDYTYDAANKPHAVKTAGGASYAYDAVGNMLSGDGKNIIWSTFNKPTVISTSNNITAFDYGPDRARYSRLDVDFTNSTYRRTLYLGGYEKIDVHGQVKHKHYIKGAEGIVATHTIKSDGSSETDYLHRDYQGSVVAISNEAGSVKALLDFDAFGQRRTAAGAATIDPIIKDQPRGYTGHEHIDGSNLIHMNGRVYDPVLARFLSADPFIQAPNNLQSYNRYSYVLNNPMSFTDPSGYFSLKKSLRKAFKKARTAVGKIASYSLRFNANFAVMYSKPAKRFMLKHEWARQVGSIGAGIADSAFGCAGACSTAFSAYLVDISGGSYSDIGKAAMTSYVSYAAFAKVNATFEGMKWGSYTNSQVAAKTLAHGAVGGLVSEAGGRDFADGFMLSAGAELLSLSAQRMRESMVSQSRLNKSNAGGKSVGFKGDKFKLGGGRYVNGKGVSISPLGGFQGGAGQMFGGSQSSFGWDYQPGSFTDYLVEAYAGPHDFLNSGYWYDSVGNAHNYSGLNALLGEGLNWVNVVVATPFVAASVMPAHTVTGLANR